MEAWPSTLPEGFLYDGTYSEEVDVNKASWQPSKGDPLEHVRSFSASTKITYTMPLITSAEFDTLMTWYTTTLKSGTQFFTLSHPRKNTQVTARFQPDAVPQLVGVAGLKLKVNLAIRVYE